MDEENDLIFLEMQKFSLWLQLVVVFSMTLFAVIDCFALQQMLSRQNPSEILSIILLIICKIFLQIGIAIFFFIVKLETEVRSDGLCIRYFPLHIRYRKFTKEDLSDYYTRTYRPILEYGGWGIRYGFGKKGRAYNVSGNKGVQLIFKNGKRLLIGSQKSDELAEAIQSIMKSS